MVGVRGDLRVLWSIVVTENQRSIGALVVIAIEDLLNVYSTFDGFFLESQCRIIVEAYSALDMPIQSSGPLDFKSQDLQIST